MEYVVEARDIAGRHVDSDELPGDQHELSVGDEGLLGGLLGTLLSLLQSNERAFIRVSAVHESGWSGSTNTVAIQGRDVLGGLLRVGVECVGA